MDLASIVSACESAVGRAGLIVAMAAAGYFADRFAFGKGKVHENYQNQWRRAAIIVAFVLAAGMALSH